MMEKTLADPKMSESSTRMCLWSSRFYVVDSLLVQQLNIAFEMLSVRASYLIRKYSDLGCHTTIKLKLW